MGWGHGEHGMGTLVTWDGDTGTRDGRLGTWDGDIGNMGWRH